MAASSSIEKLYLCIDCGGSKTAAVIANASGKVVGRGQGGMSNYKDVNQHTFLSSIRTATLDALSKALTNPPCDLSTSHFYAAWIAASGVDREQDILDLTPILSELLHIRPGPHLVISNDTNLLASPIYEFLNLDTAIVVIAGTGSNVCAFRNQAEGGLKDLGRVGGWGWILGDEGSGFQVGQETLRWILSVHEGTRPAASTTLRDAVLNHFQVTAPYDLFNVVYGEEPSGRHANDQNKQPEWSNLERKHRVASLAPLVFDAAFEQNDSDALGILNKTTKALAEQVRMLMKVPSRNIDPSRTVLCFGGSLVRVDKYRGLIVDHLLQQGFAFAASVFVDDAPSTGAQMLTRGFGAKGDTT